MTSQIKRLEQKLGKPMPEVLRELYEKYQSQTLVARELGVTQSTISLWLLRYRLKEKKTLAPIEAVVNG